MEICVFSLLKLTCRVKPFVVSQEAALGGVLLQGGGGAGGTALPLGDDGVAAVGRRTHHRLTVHQTSLATGERKVS